MRLLLSVFTLAALVATGAHFQLGGALAQEPAFRACDLPAPQGADFTKLNEYFTLRTQCLTAAKSSIDARNAAEVAQKTAVTSQTEVENARITLENAQRELKYLTSGVNNIRVLSSRYGDPDASNASERYCNASMKVRSSCETDAVKEASGKVKYLAPSKVCTVTVGSDLCNKFKPNEQSGDKARRVGWVVFSCTLDPQMYEVCGAEGASLTIDCEAIARTIGKKTSDNTPFREKDSVCTKLKIPEYKTLD